MNPILLRIIPLALHVIRTRTTEPSTLAGLAILTQIAKTYFPELGILLDIAGGSAAGGAIVVSEKGVAHEKAETVVNRDSGG